MNCLTLLEKASKLPLGHYDKAKAREAVDKEYDACHKQSAILNKKYKFKYIIEPQEAFDLCWNICDSIGQKKLKKIVVKSKDVSPFAGAHYTRGEIHFPYNYITISTLLHELTHHFCQMGGHGKEFMEMQELVYEIASLDKSLKS